MPAALDAGELAVVAGEDDFRPGLARGGQQLARHPRVEHRRLVHHDDGALVPLGAPVLDGEQRGMDGARLAEPVLRQVLRHGVRRGQAHHMLAVALVGVADRRQRVALAGARPALDQLEVPGAGRVLERLGLVGPECPRLHGCTGVARGHRAGFLAGQSARRRHRGALLLAHLPRGVPPGRSTRLAVVQRHQLAAFQDGGANRRDLPGPFPFLLPKLLGQEPVKVALGESGVVPRQRRQHLFRIARGLLVGLADGLGAFDDLRPGAPHPNRADVLLAERGRAIDARL